MTVSSSAPPRVDLLAPPPRRCRVGSAPISLAPIRAARVPQSVEGSPLLAALLSDLGCGRAVPSPPASRGDSRQGGAPRLTLREEPTADLPAQGYRLRVSASGVDLLATDRAGLLHGAATLRQWLLLHPLPLRVDAVWPIEIEDWPDFLDRGVLLDVSRNKVPTLATLERLVDRFAELKLNQLQLYTEHTFAYAGHEEVWRSASPLTPSDVRALDAYCADRGIELVPNQNSFGHLHRWLVHDPYRRLAECPEGVEHPWSNGRKEPFSLCPTDPDSLRLIEDLYEQLLPCFRSSRFNVGLDETFDLGLGRSREACTTRGRDRVYLEFLRAIHARVGAWERRMMFWGDILIEHPELLSEVPSDAIALLWGYEADHPFEEQCRALAASALEYYVCPGTSSWLSFAGRWPNALHNLAAAARAGAAQGALGYLVTDWGDRGHLQPLPISYPAWMAGACFGWNAASAADPDQLPVAELLDRWVMPELPAGAILLELGAAYVATGLQLRNSTVPFHLLVAAGDPLSRRGFDRLDPDALRDASARIDRLAERLRSLPESRPQSVKQSPPDPLPASPPEKLSPSQRDSLAASPPETVAPADLLRRELLWAAAAMRLGCDLGEARLRHAPTGNVADLPAAVRAALARRLDALIESLDDIWKGRNRSGGLADSLGYLRRVRALLAG